MTDVTATETPSPRFEADLAELEATVRGLEGGELGLDAALAAYERGVGLLARCHGRLDEAQRRVSLLAGVDEAGEPITEPFDASATVETPPTPPAAPTPRKKKAPTTAPAADLDALPF